MRTLAAEVLSYLPSESFFAFAAGADVFVVADDIQFSTNSNINRARLKIATGVQWLTIPVLTKGRRGQKLNEVEIDPTREWQRQHWRTLELNCHNAPYFGELADELELLYRQPYQKLFEVTWAFLQFFWKVLHWDPLSKRTSEFHLTSRGAPRVTALARAVDAGVYLTQEKYRTALQPEQMPDIQLRFIKLDLPPYHQQFDGFVGGLNLLDLLFNEGTAFTRQRLQAWRKMIRTEMFG